MERRGISAGHMFRLGFVTPENAAPGDEQYAGMLCIPYLTPTGPIAVKFRSLRPDASTKYLIPTGQATHLYNVTDLHKKSSQIVLAEGEIDAMTLSMLGVPAVGVPGVNNWKPFYRRVFDGYEDVVIATDNDARDDGANPGQELARHLRQELYGSRIAVLPRGYDVNSLYVEQGREAVVALVSRGE
jgi:phage/plasmid primase-like uncharacterized protein